MNAHDFVFEIHDRYERFKTQLAPGEGADLLLLTLDGAKIRIHYLEAKGTDLILAEGWSGNEYGIHFFLFDHRLRVLMTRGSEDRHIGFAWGGNLTKG
jgi:hypothetical protein